MDIRPRGSSILDLSFDKASYSVNALGTWCDLVVADPGQLDQASRILDDELRRIDRLASRFIHDSEISRLNSSEGYDFLISPELAEAMSVADRGFRLTGGLLDPTVGSALIASGYDRDFTLIPFDSLDRTYSPTPVAGWKSVKFDPARRIMRVPTGVKLDLGATAKALASDRAATNIYHSLGVANIVSLGGDISCAGPPPSEGWPVQIVEDFGGHTEPGPVVEIRSGGVATSGTTLRKWHRGSQALHHIIDPSTGYPASSPWRTVTVAAGSCVDANIAATASILIGHEAPEWLTSRSLPARLVGVDGSVAVTSGWPQDNAELATHLSSTGIDF